MSHAYRWQVLVEERRGDSVYLLGFYREGGQGPSSTRCDLHPHWDRFGCNVLFDSTHSADSKRAVYRLDLEAFAFPGCKSKSKKGSPELGGGGGLFAFFRAS